MKLRLKNWGRAFINFGLLQHLQGRSRPIPCGAGTELFFLDPYGRILACRGSQEPWVMGDLKEQSFDEIWNSPQANAVQEQVAQCQCNCLMFGSARAA